MLLNPYLFFFLPHCCEVVCCIYQEWKKVFNCFYSFFHIAVKLSVVTTRSGKEFRAVFLRFSFAFLLNFSVVTTRSGKEFSTVFLLFSSAFL